MSIYVYCTLSNDQNYKVSDGTIFIAGKANIANKHMLTARGVSTEITPEQLAKLKENHVFNLHKKNGYILVDQRKADANDVAANMNPRDESAPDTEETLAAEGIKAPKENKKKGK